MTCNIYSTQDHAAAYVASRGVPVFAWEGMSEKEYEECLDDVLCFKNGASQPNMILDDGGDLTKHILEKYPLQNEVNKISQVFLEFIDQAIAQHNHQSQS